ncbi:hypothetical protein Prudu_005393 [Prunus dulcis]|uniref:Transposable element protein n=1 Tax=Prunus dulcis TaxID=3755 RepID=A0A4Y1QXI6_PRUDU|nr:hypothetical protein Prudu_005393 [Prunus dulcis]
MMAVMLALGGRSKLGFINGTIRAPEASDPKFRTSPLGICARNVWATKQCCQIFQLKKDIAGCYQDGKPFIEHLGKLKSMWNELSLYRPHTTDSATLLKRAEEDKIFQLLASLDQEYEDLRSHILMSAEIPSLNNVCTTIQREEIRKKVMNMETKTNAGSSDSSALCQVPKCQKASSQNSEANAAVCFNSVPNDIMANFTSNPSALLGQFATYLQQHGSSGNITQNGGASQTDAYANIATNPSAFLGHFASFLQQLGKSENSPLDGTVASAETQSVSVANGMNVQVMGQGRITFFNSKTDSAALYVPSFPFQLMSVGRDRVTLRTIGRGHYLNGLYILHQMPSKSTTGVFQASSYPNGVLWHQRLGHPSDIVLSNMFSSLNNASHGCEVCRFSKQTRLSFSSSHNDEHRAESPNGVQTEINGESEVNVIAAPRRNPIRERHQPARLKDYITFASRSEFSIRLEDAMREELQALDENCTWSIVKLPQGKRAVGCKWVYKTKFKSDGSLERHKAGFVAKGFTQLEEEVYMSLPPGHPQEKKKRSSADSSLFVKDENGSKLIVLIYVDDIIITGSNLAKLPS